MFYSLMLINIKLLESLEFQFKISLFAKIRL